MRGRAGPVTEISVFATDISVTGMKISHMNTPARSPGRNFLNKIASLSQHIVQNGIILVLYVFPLRSMRIIFISKVTRFHKAVTVANNTNLCSTILVVFLEFTSVFPYEHTTELVPVTEPTRLPGSYEEALSQITLTSKKFSLIQSERVSQIMFSVQAFMVFCG